MSEGAVDARALKSDSYYVRQERKAEAVGTAAYHYLKAVEEKPFYISKPIYVKKFWQILRSIQRAANADKSAGLYYENLGTIMKTITERNRARAFNEVRYLSEGEFEELFDACTDFIDDFDFSDSMLKPRNNGDRVTIYGTPMEWNWSWIARDPGTFNIMVGQSSSGKTNMLCKIGIILAKEYDVMVITNLAYHNGVLRKNPNIFHTTRMSEMIWKSAETRRDHPHKIIIYIIDEMATRMHRGASGTKEMYTMEALMFQMRKLNISFLGIFQDIRSVGPAFRPKEGQEHEVPKHSSFLMLKGYGIEYEEGYPITYPFTPRSKSALTTLLIRFKDGVDMLIDNIHNYRKLYNTEEATSFDNGFDVFALMGALKERPGSEDEGDVPRWRIANAEYIIEHIDEWIIDDKGKGTFGVSRAVVVEEKLRHAEFIWLQKQRFRKITWPQIAPDFNDIFRQGQDHVTHDGIRKSFLRFQEKLDKNEGGRTDRHA